MTKALFDRDAFFRLPEAAIDEDGMKPLESRTQPTGFFDSHQNAWVAILTDSGLKRKRTLP